MRYRVPMPRKLSVITQDDVHIPSATPSDIGVRYSMDFAEDAHARLGQEAILYAVERLSQEIVHDNMHQIRRTVESYLRDREWAEPIIREAIREAVHDHISGIFSI